MLRQRKVPKRKATRRLAPLRGVPCAPRPFARSPNSPLRGSDRRLASSQKGCGARLRRRGAESQNQTRQRDQRLRRRSRRVGWVERSVTHRLSESMMGYSKRRPHPSYELITTKHIHLDAISRDFFLDRTIEKLMDLLCCTNRNFCVGTHMNSAVFQSVRLVEND